MKLALLIVQVLCFIAMIILYRKSRNYYDTVDALALTDTDDALRTLEKAHKLSVVAFIFGFLGFAIGPINIFLL